MRIIRAIFAKQAKDMFKNPMVLVQFIIFPAVALIMTLLVGSDLEGMPSNMFVTMMAGIFAGMGLITSMSGIIAGDIETKSLRFLILAGVKPHQYLIGVGGFILVAGAVTSVLFALIGGFSGVEAAKFFAIMIPGVAASVILGAAIGMLSKNTQAAGGLSMPFAIIIGFTPMIATFNKTVERVANILYTQQINTIVGDLSGSLTKPLLIIVANIVVLTALFIYAYRKNGLKG